MYVLLSAFGKSPTLVRREDVIYRWFPGGWMMFHTARGNLIKTWLLIKAACTARNGRMLVRQRRATREYPLLDYFLPASHFFTRIQDDGVVIIIDNFGLDYEKKLVPRLFQRGHSRGRACLRSCLSYSRPKSRSIAFSLDYTG